MVRLVMYITVFWLCFLPKLLSGLGIDHLGRKTIPSILNYGSIVWDPYLKQDIEKLERVQKQAARFILGDYRTREEGCFTGMLQSFELTSLENYRS